MISVIVWLTSLVVADHDRAAIDFLAAMQTGSGAFVSARWADGDLAKPTLRTTRTAIRAHRLLGAPVPNRSRVIAFVQACYDQASGGFAAEPGLAPDPISTSVALMVLQELELPVEPYRERALQFMNEQTTGFEQIRMVAPGLDELKVTVPNAAKWIAEIEKNRNADGSYGQGPGKARTTALSVVALWRLGAQIDREQTLKIILEGQRQDGGFGADKSGGSDLEACYRVVRLFHMLKTEPRDLDGLHAFIDACRNADGGYGRTPDEPSSLHGTYYATILRDWLTQLKYQQPKQWDFQDTRDQSLPTDWLIAKTVGEPGSDWKLMPAKGNSKNFVLAQTSNEGPKKQFNLCVTPESARDLTLSVELRAVGGQIDQGGGLVWRYLDSQNYYIMRWNPLEQNLRLYKVVNGMRSQLDTAQAPGDARTLHRLKVVAVGRNIRGYFDERLIIEAEDDQFPCQGRVGLWTKADAVTEFDNLSLQTASLQMIEDISQ